MSDHFQPLSFKQLATWVFGELDGRGSVFGIPRELFFQPQRTDAFRTELYGQPLDTPFGVAAGPHSQMAQNIIAAWLQGGRFIELKTIQTLDELKVSKPCIDMQDEGYNVEWSQELKIDQSFREYLMAWVLIHALHHKLGRSGTPGMIFNMSVGYNLDGILQPNVQGFLARMDHAGPEMEEAIAAVAAVYPPVRELAIPERLSDNVTLSTMHGCPPEEIGKIAAYLIEERGLHTNVKLNPTLLGPDMLRGILNELCGFRQVTVPDEAFGHDLKYPDALNILTDLRARAAKKGVCFGVKLSNTLEVINHRKVFSAAEKMMYLSGRPLQAVTVNLAAKLATEFKGDLRISYAGGADAWNVADLLACGVNTITSSSDLLRPGGYARLLQYVDETAAAMKAAGADSLPAWILSKAGEGSGGDVKAAALANWTAYAKEVLANPLYRRDSFDRRETKTDRPLTAFDCVEAPCRSTCPLGQDVPGYMAAAAAGDWDSAAAVVRRDNAMGGTLGRACNHACETKCLRTQYDEPLEIREIKRAAMEYGRDPVIKKASAASPAKVAIIGAGPCGLSAAAFLREAGADVTIYDSRSIPGGMAAKTLPTYRALPELIQRDAARLEAAGVRFCFHQTAGRDFTIESLRNAGFVVVIAAGAQRGMPMGIEGEEAAGVIDGIEFLRQVRDGERKTLSGQVGIIGGGDVAMDCARVAKRLGGAPTVIYRRTRDEMPAHPEELAGLLEEEIPLRELSAPKAALADADGHLVALRCSLMCLGAPDASGRRRPLEVPDADFDIPLDYLIGAIGQRPDLEFIDAVGLARNKKGYIVADEATGATSVPGIYAGGDAVNGGPSTLVKALGDGKKIAAAILGVAPAAPTSCNHPIADLPELMRKRARRLARTPVPERALDDRLTFDEVVQPLTREAAQAEASRCLACDTFCSVCTSVCPNHAFLTYACAPFAAELSAWILGDGAAQSAPATSFSARQAYQTAVLTDFCNECGNCATFCPSAGRPYADKPRLYASSSEFEDQTDNAYRFTGTGITRSISGRFGGETHTLVPLSSGDGYRYARPGFSIDLNAALQPLAAPVVASDAPSGTVTLLPAAMLKTLLENISESQLPPPTE